MWFLYHMMEIAELIESVPQAQEQRLQAEEESVGLKANLRRLTLRDVSNLHDAEHAIDSALEHVGGLEQKCAEQEATLQLQGADLEAAHLSQGGPSLCITGHQKMSRWDFDFSTVKHFRTLTEEKAMVVVDR